jgi:hypothetical protein
MATGKDNELGADETVDEDADYAIFRPDAALDAFRAAGFRSTAEALFELVDNSIEAGATQVEVFAVSRIHPETGREVIDSLAVLDNGEGMDHLTLRRSLRFGDGTRFSRSGMGRFGVGLPQASMNFADVSKVWSWQSQPTNAIATQLSADAIRAGERSVPAPQAERIPEAYEQFSRFGFEDTGTLVVWNDLVDLSWKKAQTLFRNLVPLVGRTYRRFLTSDDGYRTEGQARISVTLIPLMFADGGFTRLDDEIVEVQPLDPMYLMTDTSSDESFGPGPMFQEHELGEQSITFHRVPVNKYNENGKFLERVHEDHDVTVKCSYRKLIAAKRNTPGATWPEGFEQPGKMPWGKEAAKQLGVSVLRAGRELELQTAWAETNAADERERWWGIEVSFSPELDERMGVTNNKQSATVLARYATQEKDSLKDLNETEAAMHARLRLEEPRVAEMLELKSLIDGFKAKARTLIKQQREGSADEPGARHEPTKADDEATAAIRARKNRGDVAEEDENAEGMSPEAIAAAQVAQLVEDHGFDRELAGHVVAEGQALDHLVRIIVSDRVESPAFFTVETPPGELQVALYRDHKFYRDIWALVNEDNRTLSPEQLLARVEHIKGSLRLLLYSWARMESEGRADAERYKLTRWDWGIYLDEFLADRPQVPPT